MRLMLMVCYSQVYFDCFAYFFVLKLPNIPSFSVGKPRYLKSCIIQLNFSKQRFQEEK